ncbi:MAG: hypothetical protein H3C31_02465 [Brumimicrobium sp.]|nr:hypothetical protein [Brumimicrobium sp.]
MKKTITLLGLALVVGSFAFSQENAQTKAQTVEQEKTVQPVQKEAVKAEAKAVRRLESSEIKSAELKEAKIVPAETSPAVDPKTTESEKNSNK